MSSPSVPPLRANTVIQRRYSVTGQTPPDHVAPMKPQSSPKLQALDTSVQTASCGLCEAGSGTSAGDDGRTSSKRSATQLPSPSTPSSHELPTKIARLGLDHTAMDVDEGHLTDPFPEESDWALSSADDTFSTSIPVSPVSPPSSVSDELALGPLRLTIPEDEDNDDDDDVASEDLALSPPVTRLETPQPQTVLEHHVPLTLLTLPPEIRHEIYLRLPDLVQSHPLIYCLSTFGNNVQHPLASVSRLIRSEALAIFYSYNTWIIKLEFRMMYEAFQDWMIRLGDGAASLRLVTIAVRGRLFKPRTSHAPSTIGLNGQMLHNVPTPLVQVPVVPGSHPPAQVATNTNVPHWHPAQQPEPYSPPDGDASFRIDLSEKFPGGRVELVRCDGTQEAGEKARVYLAEMVARLWERRSKGTLNGQDWIWMVDDFLNFTGWW